MDYQEFAAPLPLDKTMVFMSAEENEETMQRLGVPQEVRQLGKGRFRCDMAVRETDQATLFSDRFNKACSIRLAPPAGMAGLLVFRSAGGKFVASGVSVANDALVVVPDGSGTDLVSPDLSGSDAIAIPQSRFIEMTEALCPALVRPEEMAVFEGDTARLHALRDALVHLTAHPEFDPHPEQFSNLIAATVAWMGDSSSQRRTESLIVKKARRRVAKRTQEFIEAHYREPVHMEDLCRRTGVGVRTLQRSFNEYFDLTITDYLKAVRLDAAHRELATKHALQDSVTAIALRHGYNHLGRFSVEFRERFGESPRKTLARRGVKKRNTRRFRPLFPARDLTQYG